MEDERKRKVLLQNLAPDLFPQSVNLIGIYQDYSYKLVVGKLDLFF